MKKERLCSQCENEKKRNFTKKMFFFIILTIAVLLDISAQAGRIPTTSKITIEFKNQNLSDALKKVEEVSGYKLNFTYEDVSNYKVNAVVTNKTITEALDILLEGKQLSYTIQGRFITVKRDNAKSGTAQVKGRVTYTDGEPVIGGAVSIKGGTIGTVTDQNGEYTITVPNKDKVYIVFSCIGMMTSEVLYKGQTRINMVLEDSSVKLNEVEVVQTGYQTLSPREIASSITSIKAEDILNPSLQTIDQMLEGRVPGMTYLQSSGQLGASPKLRIRGTSTLLSSQEPLWVVDGVAVKDPVNIDPSSINDLDFVNLIGNAISGINPDDIEQIDVLKDASATAIYGKSAANGVIVLTTKKGKIGAPTVTYSGNMSITQRPRYSDASVNMMNSAERVAFSRELIEKRQAYPSIVSWVGYESAYRDYMSGTIPYSEFQNLTSYYETINTDWFNTLMSDAISTKHTISLSGGNTAMRYHASIGYNDQNGVIKGDKNETYTTSINLTSNYKRATIKFGLTGTSSTRNYTPSDIDVTSYAYNTSRAIPATNADGSYWYYDKAGDANSYRFNILEDINNSSQKSLSNGLTMQTGIDYRIIDALKISGLLSYSFNNSNSETYHGPDTFYARNLKKSEGHLESYYYANTLLPFGGEQKESKTDRKGYTGRITINYSDYVDTDKKHKLDVTFGGEIESNKYNTLAQTYRGYDRDRGNTMIGVDVANDVYKNGYYKAYLTWLQSTEAMGVRTEQVNNGISSFLTTGYGYKNDFYGSISARVDFSNEFGSRANEKFFPIWAVAGRWNFHENLLKGSSWINTLSLRSSFGYQGNVPNVPTRLVYKKGAFNTTWNEYISSISKYPNPNLKWEKTASANFGIDFSFFKNKISGTVEYYYRKTTDAFMTQRISEVNGITSYTVNRGNIENKGLDITLSFNPINNMTMVDGEAKGFRWRFDPKLGSVINKLIDKATESRDNTLKGDDEIYYTDYLNGNAQVIGRPINGFYSYRFAGLSGVDGRPTFSGFDEKIVVDGVEMSTADYLFAMTTNEERMLYAMEYSGDRVPTIQGGFDNSFTYNNLTLSINLTYSLGSKIRLMKLYPNVASENGTIAPQPVENVRREFLDRWQKAGDEQYTNIPGVVPVSEFSSTLNPWWISNSNMKKVNQIAPNIWSMYDYSDIRVVSGDYLKIQNIALRYNFTKKWCQSLFMKSGYLSANVSNIYTFCSSKLNGQDPTTQSGSSSNVALSVRPTYTLTLNVSF